MPFVPVRKKLLTIPVLKLVQDEPRYVKITGKMHLGKDQPAKEGQQKKEPAMLATVINLEDGSEAQIILSAILKSTLNDEYPNDGYVGRCFAIVKLGKDPSKAYNKYNIEEIEDPAGTGNSHPTAAPGSPKTPGTVHRRAV